jgi:hypothetical protein
MPAPLTALVRLYFDIAICRRGPQQVPAVGILLPITLIAYFLVTTALSLALPVPLSRANRIAEVAVDVVFMALWYWGLLALGGRRERYQQTASAIFGYQLLLAPLIGLSDWLVERYGNDPTLQLPVYLLYVGVLIWTVMAMAYILRAALERPLWLCVALALSQVLAEGLVLSLLFDVGR